MHSWKSEVGSWQAASQWRSGTLLDPPQPRLLPAHQDDGWAGRLRLRQRTAVALVTMSLLGLPTTDRPLSGTFWPAQNEPVSVLRANAHVYPTGSRHFSDGQGEDLRERVRG